MKPEISFLIIILATVGSCTPIVLFNAPQPLNRRNLEQFPDRYIGEYIETNDSSLYVVGPRLITHRTTGDFSIPESEIDTGSEYILKDNFIYISGTGEKVPVTIRNDSVFGTYSTFDTLFRISDENILRKFKGYYFLNFRQNDEEWSVYKLNLSKNGVASVCSISRDDELEQIKEIATVTEVKDDNGEVKMYIVKPEKGDFNKIVKNGHFKQCTGYKKVSKD